ncbi:MAG: hypothetical protein HYV02_04835 [Deltaproteobacteria bacterium]|nr:hypothetical protein [Deltaproteobacteria bacterium]
MEIKPLKAVSLLSPASAKGTETLPLGGGSTAADTPVDPVEDMFQFVASETVPPVENPNTGPLGALHAAIAASQGMAPDYRVPTVAELRKSADPTGNTFADGTVLQQYEDLRIIYLSEKIALEERLHQGTITPDEVKTLDSLIKAILNIDIAIAEVKQVRLEQLKLYAIEIERAKEYGLKYGNDHGVPESQIDYYDVNNDGIIGNPMTSSYLIGTRLTEQGTDEYAMLNKSTMQPVRFDSVTGEFLEGNAMNPNFVWDLSASGVKNFETTPANAEEGVDLFVNATGNAPSQWVDTYEGSTNTFKTSLTIPIPNSFWVETYADGTPKIVDERYVVYTGGMENGELAAPPEEIRDRYMQIQVADVVLTSKKYTAPGNDAIELGADHLLIFNDADGNQLFKMQIGSATITPSNQQYLEPLKHPSPSGGTVNDEVYASSLSIALTSGYDIGGSKDDPNRMLRSPIHLTVDSGFFSTTNQGYFNTPGGSYSDALGHFFGDGGRYVGPTLTEDGYWKESADVINRNGPIIAGIDGVIDVDKYNSIIDIPPKEQFDITKGDPAYTTIVNGSGNAHTAVFAHDGNKHLRNVTHVTITNGGKGDENYIHTLGKIEGRYLDESDGKRGTTKGYLENPGVYVENDTPEGLTMIDNPTEPGKPGDDIEVIGGTIKTKVGTDEADEYVGDNASNERMYNDDEYKISGGDLQFTVTEGVYDLPTGYSGESANSDQEMVDAYTDARNALLEEINKDPTLVAEGDLLEQEAWNEYGPVYQETQNNITAFFDEYRNVFGISVPMDESLEGEEALLEKEFEAGDTSGSTV